VSILLLDTLTVLWALTEPDSLGSKARKIIESDSNILNISTASLWEIALKLSLGKLNLKISYGELVKEMVQVLGTKIVPIEIAHLEQLLELPFHHRDPFDRLLVVTALSIDCPILSRDKNFDRYAIRRLWD